MSPITPPVLPWKPPQKLSTSCRLVFERASLRAAAVEMGAVEARGSGLAEQPEGLRALGRCEGAHDEPRGLAGERLREGRMRMTETGDRDAGEEVNEDIPVDVGERGALAMIEGEAGEHRDTLA